MDLTDSHVTVNRLETYRLTSAVVQIRLCYVYTKLHTGVVKQGKVV